jgi:zinc D-Ala-D-Ala carboxypeptidase
MPPVPVPLPVSYSSPVPIEGGYPGGQLTPHFSMAEMTVSAVAAAKGLNNTPDAATQDNLMYTAQMMERVRAALGNRPITVHSAYRSPQVNTAVGGSKTSAHVKGLAVDFNCYPFGSPRHICELLENTNIPFDQLILEFPDASNNYGGQWVHIGFSRSTPRRQVLTGLSRNGTIMYVEGLTR